MLPDHGRRNWNSYLNWAARNRQARRCSRQHMAFPWDVNLEPVAHFASYRLAGRLRRLRCHSSGAGSLRVFAPLFAVQRHRYDRRWALSDLRRARPLVVAAPILGSARSAWARLFGTGRERDLAAPPPMPSSSAAAMRQPQYWAFRSRFVGRLRRKARSGVGSPPPRTPLGAGIQAVGKPYD